MQSDLNVPDRFQISAEKQLLRAKLRARLEALPEEYIRVSRIKAGENVLAMPEFRRAKSVFTYVSTEKEPDTLALIKTGLAEGKRIYVPKIRGKGLMDAVEIRSLCELSEGAFGLQEPEDGAAVRKSEIELAIIPCLSVTVRGERLGHGGGFYDRFFADAQISGIILCSERMLSEKLPLSPFDVRFGTVVTEERVIRIF